MRLFHRTRRHGGASALHDIIVAQSRRPEFYLHCGVPDTVDGRFDMIALHAFMVLRRLKERHRDTARALLEASRQSQGTPNRQADRRSNSSPSASKEAGNRGTGEGLTPGAVDWELKLKELTGREWGQLPGHLRTEILQSSAKKPNRDYAKLIEHYFKQIATEQKTKNRSP